MSRRGHFLLILLTSISILFIVGGVWIAKNMNDIKDEIAKTRGLGAKSVLAFSTSVEPIESKQISSISQQIDRTKKQINDYAKAYVEYNFITNKEVVDKSLIESWLIVGDNKVTLDEQKVREYVENLAKKYNTVGTDRKFVDSHGKEVIVSGGPYGWDMDCDKETDALVELINSGTTQVGREPEYKQRALARGANDIGSTYVEVNMSEQKMWFYKEGELLVSTNIVTGNTTKGNGTPTLVGYIHNKARNINLVGEDYVAFVHYWMKVYDSIGIHDASWRNQFGGTIYTRNGSHGCINTPYKMVKEIYDNIDVGTPVVIFYDN